jgi:bile acid-coenzyme A ligase
MSRLGTAVSAVDRALRAAAASTPGDPALVTDPGAAGGTLTWAEVERQTAGLALELSDLAGAGAVEIGNERTSSALLLLIGALRTRIPIVLMDRSASEDEQEAVREELCRAGVSLMPAVSESLETMGLGVGSTQHNDSVHRRPLPLNAFILASGGSTGRPKLIVDTTLRSGDRPERMRVTSRLNWTAGQTQLVIGRLHHAAPLTFFLHGLIDGNRLVVPTRYAPSTALELIADQRVHWMQATPFQLQRMAAHLQRHSADLDSLRGVLHMSAPCPPAVKQFWIDRIEARRIFEIYGATEGIGMTVASGDEWLARPGTVGRGFFTQLRILDAQTLVPLPPGARGLVFLRNPVASSAPVYLRGTGGLRVSPDGFRSVGDYGHLDEDKYLFIEPRRLEMINVGGENVYPTEIEEVLVRCPGVADAAVTGVSDERLGARPAALVVRWPEADLAERDIIAFCHRHLSRFKLPKCVLVVDEIPHTPSGKIDRKRLPEMVSSSIDSTTPR